jgi:predicted TIM-barrel fold metal-dependent hydrolase
MLPTLPRSTSTTSAATFRMRSSAWTTAACSTRRRKSSCRSKVYVDRNSFGPRAIEAAVRLYGADRIVCGTDGTEFGCEWTTKALAEAQIGEDAREKILHCNAAAMLSHPATLAQPELAAR